MTFRACIVAAVSTPSQADDDRYSITAQLADGRAACERAGWPVVAEVVIPGHSRDYTFLHELVSDCPEYAQLVDLIEAEGVDLLVCRHYDRLWRNDWIRADLMRLCTIHRVQVYSVEQPRPPQPPETLSKRAGLSAIMEVLSGALSEEEQALRVKRTRDGMRGRIAAGRHHPGPTVPYGYRRTDDGLEPEPEEARWVRYVFDRRAAGEGAALIAAQLTRMSVPTPGSRRPTIHSGTVWHPSTVQRILYHDVYIGVARWGSFANSGGQHEAIIDPALFHRVQRLCQVRTDASHRSANPGNWLRGILRCGYCRDAGRDRAMLYRKVGRPQQRLYLRCGYYTELRGAACCNNGHSATRVHAYVLGRIIAALQDPAAWLAAREAEHNSDEAKSELATIRAASAENRHRWARCYQAYEAGSISLDEMVTHRARLDGDHATLQAQERRLATMLELAAATAGRLETLAEAADGLSTAPPEVKREVARALIRAVVLRRGDAPRIEWW